MRLFTAYVNDVGYLKKGGTVSYHHTLEIGGLSTANDYTVGLIPGASDCSDIYTDDSRPGGVMDLIQDSNKNNSVDYYMGAPDGNGGFTGYYPLNVFDEQTLVFTEPVTGTQYLTTGWKYDYDAQSYLLDLAAGTMYIGSDEVSQILLVYGDDAVSITYYGSSGILKTDSFQYVLVAKDQCTLTGHKYSVETLKEPTCTTTGERRYTCSVCGDQKTEDVPMSAHTAVYSEFKPATCTKPGVAMYTCSVCGTQYTEQIPELGHDWISIEDVETSWQLPADTACPECLGVEFSAELDRQNDLYECECTSCGVAWTVNADVTYGYTKYKCSVCGELMTENDSQRDGLFVSIGNLIGDGIVWCTDKLAQLVGNLTSIIDEFTGYIDSLSGTGGSFPQFLASIFSLFPEDLMSILWLSLVGLVALAVWKKWLN